MKTSNLGTMPPLNELTDETRVNIVHDGKSYTTNLGKLSELMGPESLKLETERPILGRKFLGSDNISRQVYSQTIRINHTHLPSNHPSIPPNDTTYALYTGIAGVRQLLGCSGTGKRSGDKHRQPIEGDYTKAFRPFLRPNSTLFSGEIIANGLFVDFNGGSSHELTFDATITFEYTKI